VWFSIMFFSFLLYSVQFLNSRNCKRLVSLKKQKSQGKAIEVNFVWISSKNSASGILLTILPVAGQFSTVYLSLDAEKIRQAIHARGLSVGLFRITGSFHYKFLGSKLSLLGICRGFLKEFQGFCCRS
jgi:hypothetical protein